MAKTPKSATKSKQSGTIFTIAGQVISGKTRHGAPNLRVEAWDQDLLFDDFVGSAVTDAKGAFLIEFERSRFKELFLDREPDLYFKVLDGERLIQSTQDSVLWNVKAPKQSVEIGVDVSKISGPAVPKPATTQGGQLPVPAMIKALGLASSISKALEQRGVTQVKHLFSAGGAKALNELDLSGAEQKKLLAAAKFTAVSASASLASRLAEKGIGSLAQLGRTPLAQVTKQLGELSDDDRRALADARAAATAIGKLAQERGISSARARSRDASWFGSGDLADIISVATGDRPILEDMDFCGDGDPCYNVFSPIAYLFDLLGFVLDNWNLPTNALEAIFLQEIDSIDCASGFASVPQARLAISVLEKYLGPGRLPAGDAVWAGAYRNTLANLISIAGLKLGDLPAAAAADTVSTAPDAATLDRAISALREAYDAKAERDYSSPSAPAGGGTPEAQIEYLQATSAVEQQRANAKQEFEVQLANAVAPLLAIYRDKLIAGSNKSVQWLERNLFIDLRISPTQTTNRITQIVQSIQSLVLEVRTGGVINSTRPELAALAQYQGQVDDATWNWMGNYSTWSAAMYALVYPENLIGMPIFRSSASPGFREVFEQTARPATRRSLKVSIDRYEQHLGLLRGLQLRFAQVVDDALYLIAQERSGNLWMNAALLPVKMWQGWQPITLSESPGTLNAVVLHRNNRQDTPTVLLVFRDANVPTYNLYVLDSDGATSELDELPTIDLSGNNYRVEWDVDVIFSGSKEISIGTIYEGGRLLPTFKIYGNTSSPGGYVSIRLKLYSLDSNQRIQWSMDDSVDASNLRAGTLVNQDRYYLTYENTDDDAVNIEISKEGNSSSRLQFSVNRFSQGNNPYILATCVDAPVTYLVACPPYGMGDDGVTLTRAVDLENFVVEELWTSVFCAATRMEVEIVAALTSPVQSVPIELRNVYFEERYLHIPLFAAWALNRSGDHVAAHDWYRKLYDPFRTPNKYGFPFAAYFDGDFDRSSTWLADSLDPFSTAGRRKGVYLRHVIIMMVKNLLDWADHEYALAGPESINRARELYLLAERILDAPELRNLCRQGLDKLQISITTQFGSDAVVSVSNIGLLYNLNTHSIVEKSVAKIAELRRTQLSPLDFSRLAGEVVQDALAQEEDTRNSVNVSAVFAQGAERADSFESALLDQRFNQFMSMLSSERPSVSAANTGLNASASAGASGIGSRVEMFSIPPNPLLKALDTRIQVCLAKIHAGFSIGGLPLPPSPLPQEASAPVVPPAPGMQPAITIDPPRYRYSYLVEKARQQAGFAQQLGSALLQALEKSDAESYNRLTAENAVEVASATVNLKDLMLREAHRGKDVAEQQRKRADLQQAFWDHRKNSGSHLGLSNAELSGMALMGVSGVLQAGAGLIYGALSFGAPVVAGLGAMGQVGGVVTGLTGVGVPVGLAAFGAGTFVVGSAAMAGGPLAAQSLQSFAGSAGTFGSLALTFASFERRWEDWKLQEQLANIDQTIAGFQVDIAQDRIDIAGQDQQIASLQQEHARQLVTFLKAKFSNKELYYWMIQLLTELYRNVMQTATATALAAQTALEFERQQPPTHPIVGDYWSIDANTLGAADLSTAQKNSGLLGAEKLLTAITQLDADKIATDRRRLEVAKTISLARVIPTALYELRQNGKVTFNTLMEWFDRDFPGQYLRLVKSVKVTVVALVPPIDGIHAMLSNNGGVSSVVVKQADGSFVKRRTARTYGEEIVLDSPYNDSGLFVLDYNDPMFLPFEGLGVESLWTFELPQATNRFNFDTLVDVFFTVEYTAYYDANYRQEVIQRLGDRATADCVVDLRNSFPDEWYHFKNPVRGASGAAQAVPLKFELPRSSFPTNLSDPLDACHVTMILTGALKARASQVKQWVKLQKSPPDQVFTGFGDPPGRPSTSTMTAVPGDRLLVGYAETETYVLFSTRLNQLSGDSPADRSAALTDVDPVGSWSIEVNSAIYGTPPVPPATVSEQPLIDLVDDIVVVVTVGGKVRW